MEWVETTGRTIEEAIDAALDELGVNEDELEYEVLAEAKSGFLGRFGGTEARIRARVRPISREKPGDRRRRKRDDRRRGGGEDRQRGEGGSRPGGGARTGGGATVAGESGGADQSGESSESVGDGGGSSASGQRPPGAPRRRRRGSGSGSGPGSGSGGSRQQSHTASTEDDTMSDSAVPLDEQVEVATEFTRGLMERFGVGADVHGRAEGDDDVYVDVTGADLGVLIGPRGATIDALQELVKTAVQHRTGGFTARMHIDVSGYRAARHAALADFARNVAASALETGRDQALEPMNSADRKVVHDTVAEIEGVVTISEGEDPRRRVVIRRA